MASWLNKAAILRDLSRAQGCVPVDVAGAVAAADQPPSPEIEEKEDEFFIRNYTGCDGEFSEPDLGLIKHMLNMVQEYNCPSDDESNKVIEISKINSLHLKAIGPQLGVGEPNPLPQVQKEKPKKLKKKEKKGRNVAITSLLQNQEKENKTEEMLPSPIQNAVEKVNVWLETHENNTSPKKGGLLDLEAFMSFKKKPAIEKVSKPIDRKNRDVKSLQAINNNYVPSEQAMKYYKKCQENSKMKDLVMEDMWTRVEKEMKIVDEKKKNFAECLKLTRSIISIDSATECRDFDDPKFSEVRLPYYRHALASECIVCAVKLENNQKNPQNASDLQKWWRSTPNPHLENSFEVNSA